MSTNPSAPEDKNTSRTESVEQVQTTEPTGKPKFALHKYVFRTIILCLVRSLMYIFFSPFEMEGTKLVKYSGLKVWI